MTVPINPDELLGEAEITTLARIVLAFRKTLIDGGMVDSVADMLVSEWFKSMLAKSLMEKANETRSGTTPEAGS